MASGQQWVLVEMVQAFYEVIFLRSTTQSARNTCDFIVRNTRVESQNLGKYLGKRLH